MPVIFEPPTKPKRQRTRTQQRTPPRRRPAPPAKVRTVTVERAPKPTPAATQGRAPAAPAPQAAPASSVPSALAVWDDHIATGLEHVRRRTMRPRRLAVVFAVAALGALLLNAAAMERAAETSPFGARRSASIALLHPFAVVAEALRLDRPRAALDALTGTGDLGSPAGSSHDSSDGSPVTAGNPAPVSASSLSSVSAAPLRGGNLRRAASAGRIEAGRVPTTADPLRVWAGGDSVAGYLGFGVDDLARSMGTIAAHSHYQISTGLSRPDYYDWPTHLEQDMRAYDPEVVILLVGANDDQPLQLGNGQVADFGTAAWQAEYARRVGAVMDQVLAEGRLAVWVGQPVMRSADFDAHMQLMNGVYRQQAATRSGVTFFDSRPVLSDAGGGYRAYLPDSDGTQTLMRAADGIHLTPEGGRRLAQAVLSTVLADVASRGEAIAGTGVR